MAPSAGPVTLAGALMFTLGLHRVWQRSSPQRPAEPEESTATSSSIGSTMVFPEPHRPLSCVDEACDPSECSLADINANLPMTAHWANASFRKANADWSSRAPGWVGLDWEQSWPQFPWWEEESYDVAWQTRLPLQLSSRPVASPQIALSPRRHDSSAWDDESEDLLQEELVTVLPFFLVADVLLIGFVGLCVRRSTSHSSLDSEEAKVSVACAFEKEEEAAKDEIAVERSIGLRNIDEGLQEKALEREGSSREKQDEVEAKQDGDRKVHTATQQDPSGGCVSKREGDWEERALVQESADCCSETASEPTEEEVCEGRNEEDHIVPELEHEAECLHQQEDQCNKCEEEAVVGEQGLQEQRLMDERNAHEELHAEEQEEDQGGSEDVEGKQGVEEELEAFEQTPAIAMSLVEEGLREEDTLRTFLMEEEVMEEEMEEETRTQPLETHAQEISRQEGENPGMMEELYEEEGENPGMMEEFYEEEQKAACVNAIEHAASVEESEKEDLDKSERERKGGEDRDDALPACHQTCIDSKVELLETIRNEFACQIDEAQDSEQCAALLEVDVPACENAEVVQEGENPGMMEEFCEEEQKAACVNAIEHAASAEESEKEDLDKSERERKGGEDRDEALPACHQTCIGSKVELLETICNEFACQIDEVKDSEQCAALLEVDVPACKNAEVVQVNNKQGKGEETWQEEEEEEDNSSLSKPIVREQRPVQQVEAHEHRQHQQHESQKTTEEQEEVAHIVALPSPLRAMSLRRTQLGFPEANKSELAKDLPQEPGQAACSPKLAVQRGAADLAEVLRRRRDVCHQWESAPDQTSADVVQHQASFKSELAARPRRALVCRNQEALEQLMQRKRDQCHVLEGKQEFVSTDAKAHAPGQHGEAGMEGQ